MSFDPKLCFSYWWFLQLKAKDGSEEALSRPSGLGARSNSNPRERAIHMDPQAHKRLSLPSSG